MFKCTPTNRGFLRGEFKDANGHSCSIQESSACCVDENEGSYLWLGNNDPMPEVLASQAHKYGVKTTETTGWVPYPIPDEVSIKTRMHLSQRQVQELLPLLKYFAKHGRLPKK